MNYFIIYGLYEALSIFNNKASNFVAAVIVILIVSFTKYFFIKFWKYDLLFVFWITVLIGEN